MQCPPLGKAHPVVLKAHCPYPILEQVLKIHFVLTNTIFVLNSLTLKSYNLYHNLKNLFKQHTKKNFVTDFDFKDNKMFHIIYIFLYFYILFYYIALNPDHPCSFFHFVYQFFKKGRSHVQPV